MPRSAAHNEAARRATRSAIETAAVRVFARQGFADSNMRQIAAEAHLSAGSIYRHFASKEELFQSLLDQAADGLHAAVEQMASDDDPRAVVRGFTDVFLADLAKGEGASEFFMVVNHSFTANAPSVSMTRLVDAQRTLWDAFAHLIHRGQMMGHFGPGDPSRIAVHFFAMLTGLTMMSLSTPTDRPAPDTDLVMRTLTGGAGR